VGPFNRWPTGLGFDYFYGFMGGEDSQWNPQLYRGTNPVDAPGTPEQGYNLNIDLANDAIRWLHQHDAVQPDKPFFLYFATGAVHAPHHVPQEWMKNTRGSSIRDGTSCARRPLRAKKNWVSFPPMRS
jgi:arylsulfatase A-like enzyme